VFLGSPALRPTKVFWYIIHWSVIYFIWVVVAFLLLS